MAKKKDPVQQQLEKGAGGGGTGIGQSPAGSFNIGGGSTKPAPVAPKPVKVPKHVNIDVDKATAKPYTGPNPGDKGYKIPDWLKLNFSKTGPVIQPKGPNVPATPNPPGVTWWSDTASGYSYGMNTGFQGGLPPAATTATAIIGGATAIGGLAMLGDTIGLSPSELLNSGVFDGVEETSNLDALAELAAAIIEDDYEVKNTDGLTLSEIYDAARIAEEVRLLGIRENQREFAQLQGQGMYSQALMAMEQQRALSDTRGLTAGAREGAQQQLSATQQVALAQIQNATMQQLLQIDTEALQDPRMAMEYGLRHLEVSQTLDPRNAQVRNLIQDAMFKRDNGDPEGALASWNQAMALEAEINGYKPNLSLDPAIAAIEWDRTLRNNIDALNQPADSPEAIQARNLQIALGAGLVIVGGVLKATGVGAAPGAGFVAKGLGILGSYGTMGAGGVLGGMQIWNYWNARDRNLSPHDKRVRHDNYLNAQIRIWLDAGLSYQEINQKLQEEYPPEARLPLFR